MSAPVPMLLWCPECRARHLDVGEFAEKAHHTHACQSCGHVWRPAIGPTVGVEFLPGFKNEAPRAAKPVQVGVGMPAALLLEEFGSQVWSAFGHPPYLVGSALRGKQWRDVDVRLILPDDEYEALGLGRPGASHTSAKWTSLVLAYSALGKALTGLPIDFQIQQQTWANAAYDGPRSALGFLESRLTNAKPASVCLCCGCTPDEDTCPPDAECEAAADDEGEESGT